MIFPHKWCFGGCVALPGQGSCLCHLEGVWLWGFGLFVPVRAPSEGNGAAGHKGCWVQQGRACADGETPPAFPREKIPPLLHTQQWECC